MDLEPEVIESLNALKLNSKEASRYVIGVDVGGTNTRVAVADASGGHVIVSKFQASHVKHLLEGVEKLTACIIKQMGAPPSAACLAIAGPVSELGTKAEITNYEGATEERILRVRDLPSTLFPPATTRFVNDLESCCYGILALDHEQKLHEYFVPLWGSASSAIINLTPFHHAVLAAGTGLGVGMLIKLGTRDFQVYPLEYGHALITPLGKDNPDYGLDQQLLNYLSEKLYNGKYSPEYEDVVSGRGLKAVYEFLVKDTTDVPTGLTTPEIVLAAMATPPNKHAAQALTIHYRILMRAAQNLSVGLQAKGIILAGDNQVANDPFVRSIAESLKQEFLDHPKRHWVDNVPVYTQYKSFNINLHGTLFVARSLAQ